MARVTKEILVTVPVTEAHKKYFTEQAAGGAFDCRFTYLGQKELTREAVQAADAIIGNVPADLIGASGRLEWLQLNSAGADPYIKPGVLGGKTVLTNATGAYGLAVSEHMLALVFTLLRRFNLYHENQRKHEWKSMGEISSVDGSTVLVLGLGDIGGDFARKMKALGAHVIGVRRRVKEKAEYLDEQHTMEDLDGLLPRADIVAMVLPGGAATDRLMDERRLRLMKKGAFLINVGRGNAIDQTALCKVLNEGVLGGCGLDVTSPEPLPVGDPLWEAENIVITPHVAGNFWLNETFERIVRIAGGNLKAWTCGEPMKNLVDFSTGYKD